VRKVREFLRKLLILCASLIAITVILEVSLRFYITEDIKSSQKPDEDPTGQRCKPFFVYGKVRGWRLSPNCSTISAEKRGREYAVTTHSNNHGFRDNKNYRFDKSDGTQRVIIIGDSMSFGNGVEELGRYSNLLDDMLGENVEVYNLAISNYGLDQAFLTLQIEGLRYNPDVIVLGFSDPMFKRLSRNVTESRWSKPFFELKQGNLHLVPQPNENILAIETFPDKFYLWMFVKQRISAILSERESSDNWANNAALTEKIIERLVEISRQSKSTLVIFTINPRYILEKEWDTKPDLNRLLEKLSGSNDFHFLDLYPIFKNSDYASLFYPIDGHYTVDGHILVAEELCKFFQSLEILGAIGIESCGIDKAAVYGSIEEFRHCNFNNTNKGLFLGGKCFPRECDHAGQKVECITDKGQSGRQVCRDFEGWGTVLSECK
jgi:hypothetical protein